MIPEAVYWIFLFLFAYLVGAIPFGLWLPRRFASVDLREIGSGNIGATNAGRAGGWPLGVATLICDIGKGAIPVGLAIWLAAALDTGTVLPAYATAVAAVLGHLFPIYLGFKTGGKGVATAAGCFLLLSPAAIAIVMAVFVVTAAASKRVSAGSLTAAAALPVAVLLLGKGIAAFLATIVVSVLIIGRHHENIRRLMAGTEPKWSEKSE